MGTSLGTSVRNVSTDRRVWALAFIVLFLSILLANFVGGQTGVLTVQYFPTVTHENQPFVVMATVRNPHDTQRTYDVKLYVDGVVVMQTHTELGALSSQQFTYTAASPKLGSAVRVYVEATDLGSGASYSQAMLVPQSPPEVWMSFAAFSSLSSSLTSTSTSTSSMSTVTISYYMSTLGISATSLQNVAGLSPLNVGVIIGFALIGLLIFLELTDPAYGKLGERVTMLRSRYGIIAITLLFIFGGIVFTKIVTVLAG